MTNWMTGVCETGGINIHYLRTGGSKPPLVLLHGLTGSGACCRWTYSRAEEVLAQARVRHARRRPELVELIAANYLAHSENGA